METIKVYSDEKHEAQVVQQAELLAAKLQPLVDEFNALNMGRVQTSDLPTLCGNPQMLFDARLNASIEVPAGLNREKYIQLLELPDLAKVLAAQREVAKVRTLSLDLFTIAGDKVKIIPERLELATNAKSIYITSDGKAASPVTMLLDIMERLNKLNRVMGHTVIDNKDLNAVFDTVGTGKGYNRCNLVLNPWKLKEFIQNCERIPDKKNNTKTISHAI